MAEISEIFKPWRDRIEGLEREVFEKMEALRMLYQLIAELPDQIEFSETDKKLIAGVKEIMDLGGYNCGDRRRKSTETASSFWVGREARLGDAGDACGGEEPA